MKALCILKPLLPVVAVFGLWTSGAVVHGDDTPANNAKATLADFLPGKRVIIPPPIPEGQEPPPGLNMQLLLQFEKNGNVTVGVVMNGKAMTNKKGVLTYKVDKQEVAILKNGKVDGGIVFATANPKKGDEITLTEKGSDEEITLKIVNVEKAAPLKAMPPGGPFGPAPDLEEAPRKEPEIER